MKNLYIILLPLFCLVSIADAQPSISSVSGTYGQYQSVNISGNNFGSKSTALPAVWDSCSGTSITTLWNGRWPSRTTSSHTEYYTHYTTPIRSVGLPHNNIRQYIAGCHGDQSGADAGYNVMFWKNLTVSSFPDTIYMSWYKHNDPSWVYGEDDNYKAWDYSCGLEPYTMDEPTWNNWYISNASMTSNNNPGQWIINDNGGSLDNPDQNSHNFWWSSSNISPMTNWVKIEVYVVLTDQNYGFIRTWENGTLVVNYLGPTDQYSTSDVNRTVAIGGYARMSGQPTNWRYFADVYYDTSVSRVVLGNNSTFSNCTIREAQIPISWSNTSITVSFNRGVFSNETAYLFVINSANVASSGYQITLGSGSSSTNLQWVGGTSNDPSVASNWNPAQVPTALDTITLNTGSVNMTIENKLTCAYFRQVSGYTGTITFNDTLVSNYLGLGTCTSNFYAPCIIKDSVVYASASTPVGIQEVG